MKISVMALVVSVGMATSAVAAEIAPTAVSYTDGAVEQSLTGVAGNPEEGAKIIGSKKLGNCVACQDDVRGDDDACLL